MRDINDIFDDRDLIIESMGFFNPFILEEHNVVVTEGILGTIAETIQKLFTMIKGWIDKLINFVAEKFGRSKKSKNVVKIKSAKDLQKHTDKVIADGEKRLADTMKRYDVKIQNSDIYKKLDDVLKDDNIEKKLKQKTEDKKEGEKTVGLPVLKDASRAISSIKKECEIGLKQKDPGSYVPKDDQLIRKYFAVGGTRNLTYSQIMKDKIYLSYIGDAGKDCIDQIKDYRRSLESEYEKLKSEANKETDQEKAQALVKKAKGINVMTQKTLGTAIKCFTHYSDIVQKAVESAKNK